MMTVLPTPAPPKMPTLPPFLNGQIRSMILRPVSKTSTSVVWSSKDGGSRWIGSMTSAFTGPFRSIGRPRTSNTRPRVASPTGTVMGLPVSTARVPRARPSVVVMATERTQLLPRCWATSHTSGSWPSRSISTAFRIAGSAPAGNSMSTTGPVIWMTCPSLMGGALAMSVSSSWVLDSARSRAGRDFDHLAGDVGLADLVVRQREVVDQLLGILSRILHRDHPARFLARLRLEDGVEQAGCDVAREELLQHRRGAWLEDELVAGDALGVLGRRDRQDLVDYRPLREGRDEPAVDQVDPAVLARQEVLGDQPGERQHVGEGRLVAEAGEVGLDRHARPAHRVAALAPDAHHGHVAAVLGDLAGHEADGVGVQRPGEAAIRGDQDQQALATGRLGEQRMILAAEHGGDVGEDLVDLLAVRPRCERRLLRAPQLRGRDELHRPRDLLDVLRRGDATTNIARTSHGRRPSGGYAPAAGSFGSASAAADGVDAAAPA